MRCEGSEDVPRILFVNKGHPHAIGGAEEYIRLQGLTLAEAGWKVGYVTPPRGDSAVTHLPHPNISYETIPVNTKSYVRKGLDYVRKVGPCVARAIARFKPDVLVDNVAPIPAYGAHGIAKQSQVKQVSIIHEVRGWRYAFLKDNPLVAMGQLPIEWSLRRFEGYFVSVGRSTSEALARLVSRERIFEIPNAIETKWFSIRRTPARHPLVLVLTRLAKVKNVSSVLRAWVSIESEFPSATLVIAGSGPQEDALRGLAKRLALRSVVFEGQVTTERKAELLETAWIYVLPTLHEGFGISIVEAMAAGVPVVTGSVPGVRDYAVGGLNCIECNPRDWHSITVALRIALSDPAVRRQLSHEGKRTAARYAVTAVRKRILEVYEAVIAK